MAFIVGGSEHTANDKTCCECVKGFPQKCSCGGLIHAEHQKTLWDNGLLLIYSCDKCLDKYKFLFDKKKKFRLKK